MESVLKKLAQIKKLCAEHSEMCDNCIYYRPFQHLNREHCTITSAVFHLGGQNPEEWDLDLIKEILNDTD